MYNVHQYFFFSRAPNVICAQVQQQPTNHRRGLPSLTAKTVSRQFSPCRTVGARLGGQDFMIPRDPCTSHQPFPAPWGSTVQNSVWNASLLAQDLEVEVAAPVIGSTCACRWHSQVDPKLGNGLQAGRGVRRVLRCGSYIVHWDWRCGAQGRSACTCQGGHGYDRLWMRTV